MTRRVTCLLVHDYLLTEGSFLPKIDKEKKQNYNICYKSVVKCVNILYAYRVQNDEGGAGIMAEVRKKIIFHGRVQGVGFRYTAKQMARSLGLTGWVKNEYDGTVLMEVQGREPMIYKLMEGLNRNMFIDICWIDSEDIPAQKENGFVSR